MIKKLFYPVCSVYVLNMYSLIWEAISGIINNTSEFRTFSLLTAAVYLFYLVSRGFLETKNNVFV